MKIRLTKLYMISYAIFVSGFTILTIFILLSDTPLGPRILTVAVNILYWISIISSPYELELGSEGVLHARAISRSYPVSISDIVKIDARRWNRGFIIIIHTRGRVSFPRTTPGISSIIKEIRAKNPDIIFIGTVEKLG